MVGDGDEGRKLADQAREILPIMQNQARRALVLELTGTPKAGKTTSVSTLKSFLKECGFKVYLLKERAADCPLPMKGHFFFNAWTTMTMMAEVLATVDTDVDIVILDRGFFDALVWLELQDKRGQVTADEKKAFSDFVMLKRWRSLVDVTVVMKVTPEVALVRENQGLIVPRTGSIMNTSALEEFNKALTTVQDRYHGSFNILNFDSSVTGVVKANMALVAELLPRFREWADRKILVVPRETVVALFGKSAVFDEAKAAQVWTQLRDAARVMLRSEAENNDDVVQLIACGVHTNKDGVFVFKRSADDNKRNRYGERMVWKGCHLECSTPPSIDQVKDALVARIHNDLHLAIELNPKMRGMVWEEEPEPKHLGIVFQVNIESDDVVTSMREKEFRKSGRQHTLIGTFQKPEDLLSRENDLNLEPWSAKIVREMGGWS